MSEGWVREAKPEESKKTMRQLLIEWLTELAEAVEKGELSPNSVFDIEVVLENEEGDEITVRRRIRAGKIMLERLREIEDEEKEREFKDGAEVVDFLEEVIGE